MRRRQRAKPGVLYVLFALFQAITWISSAGISVLLIALLIKLLNTQWWIGLTLGTYCTSLLGCLLGMGGGLAAVFALDRWTKLDWDER